MIYQLFGLLVLIASACYYHHITNQNVTVEIANGKLVGEHRGHFYAFEGIPYATAERFEPPSPYTREWTEPWDATHVGSACLQWSNFEVDTVEGSEDCLFINVYTPSLSEGEKMPVFVRIHGGAFMFGNGHANGPEMMMTRAGIVVNFNYRLGPLGFLTTEDEVVPGNMGFKDQVEALKWVQKNIAAFGGDPEQVTLTGFSVGAASVHLHYMSPLSVGLFKNGISHSGSALNPWVLMENGKERTKKLAKTLSCSMHDSKEMIDCLKTRSAEDILRALIEFQPWRFNPFSPFAATVEKESPGAFIIAKPVDILKSGKFQRLPLLTSATQLEGLFPAAQFLTQPEQLSYIDQNWNEVMPNILQYNDTIPPERLNEVSQKIRQHYLGDRMLNKNSFPLLVDIASDRIYKNGLSQAVRLHSAFAPSYFYYMKYKPLFGIVNHYGMVDEDFDFGVGHGDDVQLLYSNNFRGDALPYTSDEKVMTELLLTMYFSFGATGVPSIGTYTIPPVECNEEYLLKHADIEGPFSIKTSVVQNYGEEMYWMSLGLLEK